MINIKELTLVYDDRVILKNITHTFKCNKIYGLVGKNGAGKTSLLNTIARINQKNTGEIYCNETSLKNLNYLEIDIVLINNDKVYFEHLTVYEHFKLLALYLKEGEDFIELAISRFNLKDYINLLPEQLSLGTLQRLMIGMLLSQNHKYILADEPFNGLDPVQCQDLVNVLKRFKSNESCIIISSHILEPLLGVCDEILLLEKGVLYSLDEEDILGYEALSERLRRND